MQIGLFSLGLGLILIPVGLRNQAVSGDFLITTSQFGPNFYIGNNQKSNGQYNPVIPGRGNPEFEQIDAIAIAEKTNPETSLSLLDSKNIKRYLSRSRALAFSDVSKMVSNLEC